MSEYSLFTSESVSEGHPDKIADQISDAVLDAIISQDKHARVACETMVKTGVAIVSAGRDHEHNVAQMHQDVPAGTRVTPVDVVDNISTALGIAAQGLAVTLAPAYVSVLAKPFGLVMRRVVQPESVRKLLAFWASSDGTPIKLQHGMNAA